MKDPQRIPIILSKLEELWTASPDLRFTQLIDNILYGDGATSFYVEDEEFEEALRDYKEFKSATI